jgi:tRNA(Ile)-lysidine synthase
LKHPEADADQALRLDPRLSDWPGSGTIVVAFSGGPDSACLLHLLAVSQIGRPIQAVHVDHGLDHGSALRAERASRMADMMGVPCQVEKVQVRRSGSIEANARRARYAALTGHIGAGDVLVTAHHADDVAETMLLRLLRGSGPSGLGGIPANRRFCSGHLIRPLLGWRRKDIKTYLQHHGLSSIHDPANDLVSMDRNFLRHEVLPLLREHFPGCIQAFARSARLNRAAGEVLAELAERDLDQAEHAGPRLDLGGLEGLAPYRQAEAVRRWCLRHGRTPPSGLCLDEFMRQVEQAAEDRQPALDWEESRLQRFGNAIWLRPRPKAHEAWSLPWDGTGILRLPESIGWLQFSAPPAPLELTVRSGVHGERLRLSTGGRQAVKKILAAAGVPPWQRPDWPRIWYQDQLVAVGDRWLDPAFSELLQTQGLRLFWQSELQLQ